MAEGKKPDAAELSKVIHDSMCDRAGCEIEPKEHLAEIAQQLADFQREILLAAAQEIQEYCASYDMPSDRIIGLNTAIEMLERLAEGRQP